ncbi:F-box domain-containing protein [Seiridium cupressi]
MPAALTLAERLKNGQACYKSGHLIEASHHFKFVIKNCSCQAGKPNLECTCSDFLAACKNRTLDGALRTSCTCPRRAQKRCKDESHITALGSLVMVAVKAKDYKLGLVYAQNLVYLAPRDPRGYLRVGQLLRLTDKHHTALAVYQQGIGLVTRANPNHSGLQALQEQEKATRKSISQVDPLEALPSELLVLVLSYLKTRQHCRCLRVSKLWKAFMQSHAARPLWLTQHFEPSMKTPIKSIKPNMVQKYFATYPGGQLRSLRIDDCTTVPLVRSKFISVLRICPHLHHLALGGSVVIEACDLPSTVKLPKLKSFYLGPQVIVYKELLDHLVKASRDTLEELHVFNLQHQNPRSPRGLSTPDWPRLPILHTLKLEAHPGHRVDMGHIVHITPNVRTVWLDNMCYDTAEDAMVAQPPELQWPSLQRVSIKRNVLFPMRRVFPTLTEAITELVLEGPNLSPILGFPADANENTPCVGMLKISGWTQGTTPFMPRWNFPNLERLILSSRYPLTAEAMFVLIRPSIQSGTLRHLDLDPFPWEVMRCGGFRNEDATCVTALRINCLIGEVGRYVDDADETLLELVSSFPNLENLDLGPETVSTLTVGRILEAGVRNVYHTQGARLLELKEYARSMGKDVIRGPYYDIDRTRVPN